MHRTAILFCATGILSTTAFAADKDFDGHDDTPASAGATFDCDDTNPDIYPGALDIPMDGIDQDCSDGDAPWPYTEAEIEAFAGAHKGLSVKWTPRSMWNCEQGGGTISADATECVLADDGMLCDVLLTGKAWVVSTTEQCEQTAVFRGMRTADAGLSEAETEAVQGMLDGLTEVYLSQEGFETYRTATEERLVGIESDVAANANASGRNTLILDRLFNPWEDDDGNQRSAVLPGMQAQINRNIIDIETVETAVGTNTTAIAANTEGVNEAKADRVYFSVGAAGAGFAQPAAINTIEESDYYQRGPRGFALPIDLSVGVVDDDMRAGLLVQVGPSWDSAAVFDEDNVYVEDAIEMGARLFLGGQWVYGLSDEIGIGPFAGLAYHASGGNPVLARTRGFLGQGGLYAEYIVGQSDDLDIALFGRGTVGYEVFTSSGYVQINPDTLENELVTCESNGSGWTGQLAGGVTFRWGQ